MWLLLDEADLNGKLRDLSRAIAGSVPNGAALAIVGVRRRGEVMAQRMLPILRELGLAPKSGALDITLYRDDLTTIGPNAILRGTEIDFDLTDMWIVLVDDVLYTGRSIRAALDALVDLGRPRAIRLAVLVDRGHRELPIQPDFVGLTVETEGHQIVKVKLREVDGIDRVELVDQVEQEE